jgi:hypothetical protein|tara:strand:+ start:2044 stop:2172 length:129 start_codon:yes stop_codon:yes gene_type:complete
MAKAKKATKPAVKKIEEAADVVKKIATDTVKVIRGVWTKRGK